jgi:GxxExxY protein
MPLIHGDLSEKIIGAAMRVHSELKPGLDEKIYENALVLELESMGLQIQQQSSFKVTYREKVVGTLIPDLIVNEAIIVDTKVATSFHEAHIAQMMGYLAITNLRVALLVNFKNARLEWKRVVK